MNQLCYVDVNAKKSVFSTLTNNYPKVNYDGKCFSYKLKHSLTNIGQLRALIKKNFDGLPVVAIKDAYPNTMEDLQALKGSGDICLLSTKSKGGVAYPIDLKLPAMKVDDDLKQLFHQITLPHEMTDVEKDLQKNGWKSATDNAKRRAMAIASQGLKPVKKKKLQISKKTKTTNVRLPKLFM